MLQMETARCPHLFGVGFGSDWHEAGTLRGFDPRALERK